MVHREWEEVPRGEGLPDRGQWLSQWLRFQGPVPLSRIGEVFGVEGAEIGEALGTLVPEGVLIYPVEVEGLGQDLVCDAENLELLLRLKRAGARPEIEERPASLLGPFLALRQGVAGNRADAEVSGAAALGEWAAGLELPVELWEAEVLNVRRSDYRGEDLEEELREGRLLWYGAGKGRTGFCRPDDLDLVLPVEADGGAEPPCPPFDRPDFFDTARSYREIKDAAGLGDRVLIPAVWDQVWKGRLSSDSWEALRREDCRKPGPPSGETGAGGLRPFTHRRIPPAMRAARERRGQNTPLPGRWFSLDREPVPNGPLDQDELDRDRVRLLLTRWGILCRPLLERESPALSWARLLPTIRRMELAGELVAGRFFSGIVSLQFASPGILRELEEAESFCHRGGLFGINAADPASLAALGLEDPDPRLPARSPRNRLYYRGRELIAVSTRNGKELRIFIPPQESAGLPDLTKAPRLRKVNPEKKLVVETINGQAAAESPYARLFTHAGFIADRGRLYLW